MNMNWTSFTRGAVAAAFVAVALALASTEINAALAAILLVVAHALVPISAAWWGRRCDPHALDVGLAALGLVYAGIFLFMPRGIWSGGTYVAVAIGYAGYAVLCAGSFAALEKWRTVLRVRGFRRLRAERTMLRAEPAPAE